MELFDKSPKALIFSLIKTFLLGLFIALLIILIRERLLENLWWIILIVLMYLVLLLIRIIQLVHYVNLSPQMLGYDEQSLYFFYEKKETRIIPFSDISFINRFNKSVFITLKSNKSLIINFLQKPVEVEAQLREVHNGHIEKELLDLIEAKKRADITN